MKKYKQLFILISCLIFIYTVQCGQKNQEGSVFFISPKEGAKIKGVVKVEMGLKGMKIHPAGKLVDGTGHHHILINQDPMPKGTVIPADENHIHFGKGQTSTELKLKPGKYKLTLQFADGEHRSYGPKLSSSMHIEVEE